MFTLLKRLTDSARLAKQLEEAEQEIKTLRARLAQEPSFREVAKDFPVDKLFYLVQEKVVEDLSLFVEEEAIRFLKKAMKSASRDKKPLAPYGRVAYEAKAQVYRTEFHLPSMATTVNIVGKLT